MRALKAIEATKHRLGPQADKLALRADDKCGALEFSTSSCWQKACILAVCWSVDVTSPKPPSDCTPTPLAFSTDSFRL